jgi:hypothetical protein
LSVDLSSEVTMRLSIALLAVAVVGVLGGAALIGLPVLGGAIIFESLCAGAWAVLRDDGRQAAGQLRGLHAVPSTHEQVLERYRAS